MHIILPISTKAEPKHKLSFKAESALLLISPASTLHPAVWTSSETVGNQQNLTMVQAVQLSRILSYAVGIVSRRTEESIFTDLYYFV